MLGEPIIEDILPVIIIPPGIMASWFVRRKLHISLEIPRIILFMK